MNYLKPTSGRLEDDLKFPTRRSCLKVIWRSLLKVTEGNFVLTDKKEEKNDHLKNSKNLKKIMKTLSFEYENFWRNENTKRCPKMYIATTHTHKRQPSVKILLIKTILTFLIFCFWYFYFGTYGIWYFGKAGHLFLHHFITVGNWTRGKHYNK